MNRTTGQLGWKRERRQISGMSKEEVYAVKSSEAITFGKISKYLQFKENPLLIAAFSFG